MGKPPNNRDVRFWRDPDLPGVEARTSEYREAAFREHAHPTYSIGAVESGRVVFALHGANHEACAGQMVFIEPDAVHACNPDPDGSLAYRMFYVSTDRVEAVAAETLGPDAGLPKFVSPVADDPELVAVWRALHEAMIHGGSRLEKESLLTLGLAGCIERHARLGAPQPSQGGAEGVERARTLLIDRLADKISLDELAEAAGVSRYHFLRVFQAETGLTPHAYQSQLRVDQAKTLLAKGLDISRVAAETGFADQSHFTRVFRRFTGATPNQYRASG